MDLYLLNNIHYYRCIHTHTNIMYGTNLPNLEDNLSIIVSLWAGYSVYVNWFGFINDLMPPEKRQNDWTGQQVLCDSDVFPDCSTREGLTSMNNNRATGICWFKNRLDRQNTFKLHTHTNCVCVIFSFLWSSEQSQSSWKQLYQL